MNKFIKPIFSILFVLVMSANGYCQRRVFVPAQRYRPNFDRNYQPRQNATKRLEQVKEAFIGRQLNLNPEQARSFWPLYHQYIQDQTAVRIMKRENNSQSSPNGSVQLKKELDYETELVNIRKHYLDEFLKILPPEKVSQLFKSERAFNDEVVRQLSERSIPPPPGN